MQPMRKRPLWVGCALLSPGAEFSLSDKLSLSWQSAKTICGYRPQRLFAQYHAICIAHLADNLLWSHRF